MRNNKRHSIQQWLDKEMSSLVFCSKCGRPKNQERNSQTKMVARYAKNAGLMKRIIIKKITGNEFYICNKNY